MYWGEYMKKRRKIWIIGVAIVLLLVIVTSIVMITIANSVVGSMANVRVVRNDATLEDYGLIGERISVRTRDRLTINAYMIPHEDSRGSVLILHGMHGMDATSLFDYARFVYDLGFTPVVVDMRAHGKSEGNSLGFGYTEVWDVMAVIEYLKQDVQHKDLPIILYGLSMGGSTAINVAAQSEDVDGIVAISPYRSIQAQFYDYMIRDGMPNLLAKVFEPFVSTVLWFRYRVNPVAESPERTIQQLADIPILIAHGDKDTQTGVGHSRILYDLCSSSKKELWIAERRDHLIVDRVLDEESEFYRERITAFLNGYF